MSRETCEGCGKDYWLRHSRWDPDAFPFDMVEVDEENKTVKIKETEESKAARDYINIVKDKIMDRIDGE